MWLKFFNGCVVVTCVAGHTIAREIVDVKFGSDIVHVLETAQVAVFEKLGAHDLDERGLVHH